VKTSLARLQFWIDLDLAGFQYRFLVKYLTGGGQTEYFQVTAGKRSLLIASNRPTLRQQGHFGVPTYTVVEGGLARKTLLPKLLAAIDGYVEENLY